MGFGSSNLGSADSMTLIQPFYDFPSAGVYGSPVRNANDRTLVSPAMVSGHDIYNGVYLGQSLFASSCTGSTGDASNPFVPAQTRNENGNIYDGGIYNTKNPMLGCTAGIASTGQGGVGTNIISFLQDKLRAFGHCDRAIAWTGAVGSTAIQNWLRSQNGDQKERTRVSIQRALASGIPITHVWMSNGTTIGHAGLSQAYTQAYFQEWIDEVRLYFAGPILINQESYYPGDPPGWGNGVRAGQAAVVNEAANVFFGIDFDAYGASFRQPDGVHFTYNGASQIADEMVTRLVAKVSPYTVP